MFQRAVNSVGGGGGGSLTHTQESVTPNASHTATIKDGIITLRGSTDYTGRLALYLYIENGTVTEIQKITQTTYSYDSTTNTLTYNCAYSNFGNLICDLTVLS